MQKKWYHYNQILFAWICSQVPNPALMSFKRLFICIVIIQCKFSFLVMLSYAMRSNLKPPTHLIHNLKCSITRHFIYNLKRSITRNKLFPVKKAHLKRKILWMTLLQMAKVTVFKCCSLRYIYIGGSTPKGISPIPNSFLFIRHWTRPCYHW